VNVLNFLLSNWDSVLLVAAVIAVIVALIVKKQWGILESIVFAMVNKAEHDFGGGVGKLKREAVVEWVYEALPAVVRLFVTKPMLVKLIESVLAEAKHWWDENPEAKAYIGKPPEET
jgi:hypothetical protein